VIATGIHGSPTDNHLIEIFGPLLDRVRSRVAWHDARDILSMRAVGNDSFGETVYLNDAVFQADTVLAIGSVEPHYFAGYTGGRKSLFPGLCDFATTERNHNLANSLDAQPMRLDGNPVAEHLASLLRLIDTERVVTIQAVQDISHQLAGIAMGSLERAFHEMVTTARKFYGHAVGDPYDVVVCEMNPPLDSNLYQGQKAIENSQHAVADSGAIVLVSACYEGIGSEHFFALADNWDPQRNEPRDGHFSYGSHKLSRMNAMSRRIHIHLYSDVPAADARRVFYEPIEDLSEFLENEAKGKGQFRLAVVHDAGHTVVKLN
jgi:nickel-dependent lactate racemase